MTQAPCHMRSILALAVFGGLMLAALAATAQTPLPTRFFFSGDGHISLVSRKNGAVFEGAYRDAGGRYDPEALKRVHRVFGAPYVPGRPQLSLRLIEYLDYLEDRLKPGARITITSGYRSPAYNRQVRQGGGLAAKASLHQYGMAADLVMAGVSSRKLWDKVKQLGFGGAGYYQGETVHIDVGPARSWDQKTSGVGTGISDDNKLIGLVTDYDIYPPGGVVTMRFIRMTAFPIGVSAVFVLRRHAATGAIAAVDTFEPVFNSPGQEACHQLADIEQMAFIRWQLPGGLPEGRYDILARFCARRWEQMPAVVHTPVFAIAKP
ncbi:MAG: DUF882 domain-containing protein [Desulfobacterales bacterium]|nr:DUF882 domain-containing protein [Desulfobacterales bacterium]MDJ0883122.1 DUF882 domain-containing protein [Desulfobacterales bacterium]